MINGKSVLCVIPARAGSKRIPGKNGQRIGHYSLVDHAFDCADNNRYIDTIVVSTELHALVPDEAVHHMRKPSLCGDNVDISDVIKDVCEKHTHDIIITLQPATPLRTPALIDFMLEGMLNARCKGALTMSRCVPWTWRAEKGQAENAWHPGPYPRSQDVVGYNLQEINTVQIATRESVLAGKRWDFPLFIAELPLWATLDIDEPEDLEDARGLFAPMMERLAVRKSFPFHVVHDMKQKSFAITTGSSHLVIK